MEKYQNIIVVSVITTFVVLIIGALLFSQGGGIASQRFRAKPEAQRTNAQPIYSSRTDRDSERSGTVAAPNASAGTTDGGPSLTNGDDDAADTAEPTWILIPTADEESLESSEEVPAVAPETAAETPALLLLREASAALSPADALARIASGTASLDSAAAAASIYSNTALLYMQLDPPATEAAYEAIQTANAIAATPEERADVATTYAELLRDAGEAERAAIYLSEMLDRSDTFTPSHVRARLVLGSMYHEAGKNEDALAVYRQAEKDALKLVDRNEASGPDAYRQVCLRLSRLLRDTGDEEGAEAVVARMHESLGRAPAP